MRADVAAGRNRPATGRTAQGRLRLFGRCLRREPTSGADTLLILQADLARGAEAVGAFRAASLQGREVGAARWTGYQRHPLLAYHDCLQQPRPASFPYLDGRATLGATRVAGIHRCAAAHAIIGKQCLAIGTDFGAHRQFELAKWARMQERQATVSADGIFLVDRSGAARTQLLTALAAEAIIQVNGLPTGRALTNFFLCFRCRWPCCRCWRVGVGGKR